MEQILQGILSGLAFGSLYALIAQGYYVTHITTNILNFALGEFLMIGAMVGLALYVTFGLPLPLVFVIIVALEAVMGVILQRVAVQPLRSFLALGWIISTVGVGLMLRNIALLVGGRNVMPFPSPFGSEVVRFGPAGLFPQEVFVFVVAIASMAGLFLFLKNTLRGKALLAIAFNRDAAALMGINVRALVIFAFVLSSALAGVAGVMVAPITYTSFFMGTSIGLKAFAAAILGGLENPFGILVGGLLLGVIEKVASVYNSSYQDGAAFVVILLLLIVRPSGLFGKKVIQKV